MIVVKLIGGLGNQMFQYAAGRALSVRHQRPLYLDLSFLEADAGNEYTKRNYELNQFCITGLIASSDHLIPFSKTKNSVLHRLFSSRHAPKLFNENGSSFNPGFEKIYPDVYLNGYWQSEKYFSSIKNVIYSEFMPAYDLSATENLLLDEIKRHNSVSIHVRRGDYVHLKSAAEYHGTCSMDYYNSAISYIKSKVQSPVFFIFSDDIAWCRENFKHVHTARFVDGDKKHSGFDLHLMSHCKHNIIANSSYSWWGAWLNRNAGKIVIAPQKWFAPGVPENKDLLPGAYIKI